ncbi:MAG: hypothetical protein HY822_21935 [Acidobacteria bacterium]|nr:hypothetical protein [Acidobacteriota bacterium]
MRLAVLPALLTLVSCSPPPERPAETPPPAPAAEPRIVQFYAYPSEIAPGERSRICYGVENAVAARIDPRPGGVPAYANRCFDVALQRTTDYLLDAEGAGGRRLTRSLRVAVRARTSAPPAVPPPPDASPAPRVDSFTVSPAEIGRGGIVTLCYATSAAAAVRIEPPAVDFRLPARGCFGHAPERSTVYRLTASGPHGSDTREAAVTVR